MGIFLWLLTTEPFRFPSEQDFGPSQNKSIHSHGCTLLGIACPGCLPALQTAPVQPASRRRTFVPACTRDVFGLVRNVVNALAVTGLLQAEAAQDGAMLFLRGRKPRCRAGSPRDSRQQRGGKRGFPWSLVLASCAVPSQSRLM